MQAAIGRSRQDGCGVSLPMERREGSLAVGREAEQKLLSPGSLYM